MNCVEKDCVEPVVLQVENVKTSEVLAYSCCLPHLATFMAETKDIGADILVELIPIIN